MDDGTLALDRLPEDCQEVQLDLPCLVNGSLGRRQSKEIREHLIRCAECRMALREVREAQQFFSSVVAAGKNESLTRVRPSFLSDRFASLGWAAMLVVAIGGVTLFMSMLPEIRNSEVKSEEVITTTGVAAEIVLYEDNFENQALDGWAVLVEEANTGLRPR